MKVSPQPNGVLNVIDGRMSFDDDTHTQNMYVGFPFQNG